MKATVSERLKFFIAQKGLSIRAFERSCSLSNGYVNGIETTIMPNKLSIIRLRYPELNIDWLLYGEGEMLKPQGVNVNISSGNSGIAIGSANQVGSMVNVALPEKGKKKIVNSDGVIIEEEYDARDVISYNKGVPYYDVDFQLGFDELTPPWSENKEYLINIPKYNNATVWCNASGDSMEPEINSGDIVALQRIEDFRFLSFDNVYAIVTTNNMRTIKRIGRGESPNSYRLIPTNKEYEEQDLPKDMILHVYKVLGCIKRF